MKSWKKYAILFVFSVLLLQLIPSVNAIGLTGALIRNYTADPGDVVEDSFIVRNTEADPRNVVIKVEDFIIDPQDPSKRTYDVDSPYGMKSWIEFTNETTQLSNPEEKIEIKYKINIPTDVEPGTYMTSFNLTSTDPNNPEVGVAVAAKILGNIYLTVNGDFEENMEVSNFTLDDEKFKNGEIVFNLDLKNNGNVSTIGSGNIKIYDSKGEQIKGVYAIVSNFDGQEVVTERKDELIINPNLAPILPGAPGIYRTPWTHRTVKEGEYIAKLEFFYGKDNKNIEKELKFEISQNFAILDLNSENLFSSSLPVNFKAKLANTGNINLSPKGYFEIRNIFGSQKERTDIGDLTILGGQELELSTLKWNSGFALGLYSANLIFDVNGQKFEKSTMFWVINWWQALIVIVILSIVVFIIYKGVKGYYKMKKKLEKIKDKKE
jgi:hypothetical protein